MLVPVPALFLEYQSQQFHLGLTGACILSSMGRHDRRVIFVVCDSTKSSINYGQFCLTLGFQELEQASVSVCGLLKPVECSRQPVLLRGGGDYSGSQCEDAVHHSGETTVAGAGVGRP